MSGPYRGVVQVPQELLEAARLERETEREKRAMQEGIDAALADAAALMMSRKHEAFVNYEGINRFLGAPDRATISALEKRLNELDCLDTYKWQVVTLETPHNDLGHVNIHAVCDCGVEDMYRFKGAMFGVGLRSMWNDYIQPTIATKKHECKPMKRTFTKDELSDAWDQINESIKQSRVDAEGVCSKLAAKYPGIRIFPVRMPSYAPQRYTAGPEYLPQYYLDVSISQYDSVHPGLMALTNANTQEPPPGLGHSGNTKGFYHLDQVGDHHEIYWVNIGYHDAHEGGW